MMARGILGKKLGMTQIFEADGTLVPVTVVEAGPCVVLANKTEETDGYNAIQLGFGDIKEKHVNKPMKGFFDKAGVAPVKFVREFRLAEASEYKVGDKIAADIFAAGDLVDAIGVSRGKGFAGTIERHNFARGPMKHGSKSHRERSDSLRSWRTCNQRQEASWPPGWSECDRSKTDDCQSGCRTQPHHGQGFCSWCRWYLPDA